MKPRQTKGERQRTADRQRGEMGGRNKKERKKRVERETSGKNAGWKDDGIKGKRWERGSAHGKYAV